MTTKRLISPDDSDVPDKSIRKSPKILRPNACLGYLEHLMNPKKLFDEHNSTAIKHQVYRFLLVNIEYFNFLAKTVNVTANMFYPHHTSLSISLSLNNYSSNGQHDLRDIPFVNAFLKLTKRKDIIFFYDIHENFNNKEKLKEWIKIFSELKNNVYLERIHLLINCEQSILLNIFLDLLGKKINKIYISCGKNKTFLGKRFELDCLITNGLNSNITGIMRAKTRQVQLDDKNGLMKFSEYEKLKPNPWIKKFETSIQFCYPIKNDSNPDESLAKFKDLVSTKYRKAINCLKGINPDIELKFSNSSKDLSLDIWRKANGLENSIMQMKHAIEIIIENIKIFIDMVQNEGMKICCVEIREDIYGVKDKYSDEVIENTVNGFQFNLYKNIVYKLMQYNGVEINTLIYIY